MAISDALAHGPSRLLSWHLVNSQGDNGQIVRICPFAAHIATP